MTTDKHSLAWQIFSELRKEAVEAQKIRAQILGFKITFVSTSIGLILANFNSIPHLVLVIPALSAVFFDILISSCNASLRRIGLYLRTHIEPTLKDSYNWPQEVPLWEEFLSSIRSSFKYEYLSGLLSAIGNFGITLLASLPAIWALFNPFQKRLSLSILMILVISIIYDFLVLSTPAKRYQNLIRGRIKLKSITKSKDKDT